MPRSRVFPWSYSSLTAFEQCPLRYKLTKITKAVREPQSDAMRWGNEVHKALELAVGNDTPLPAAHASYQPIVDKVKAFPGVKMAEQSFGLTKDFQPTEFFGRDVWFRGKIDLNILRGDTAVVCDWKTGKVKDDPTQLSLFAGATFALYPTVNTVHARFIWLQSNETSGQTYTRDQAPKIWEPIMMRLAKMQHADDTDTFPPNPSGLCKRHCPVGRDNCDYCGG